MSDKSETPEGNESPDSSSKTSPQKDQGAASGEKSGSLTDTSKTAFNDRAWNDPPTGLMSSGGHSATPNAYIGRSKLNARVSYEFHTSTRGSSSAKSSPTASGGSERLDASRPPPKIGFVATSSPPKSPPKAD